MVTINHNRDTAYPLLYQQSNYDLVYTILRIPELILDHCEIKIQHSKE